MNLDTLYEILDMESPEDFDYFENVESLMCCDEDIDGDLMLALIKDIDKQKLAQLLEGYLEELSNLVPDSEMELYAILDNERRALVGMCKVCGKNGDSEDETLTVNLADEMARFKRWFIEPARVGVESIDHTDYREMNVRDALCVSTKMEQLTGVKCAYDFSPCLDYTIEEYIMSFGEIIDDTLEEIPVENQMDGFMGM